MADSSDEVVCLKTAKRLPRSDQHRYPTAAGALLSIDDRAASSIRVLRCLTQGLFSYETCPPLLLPNAEVERR